MKKTFFVFGTLLVVTAMLLALVSDIAWSGDRALGRRHEPTSLRKTNGSPVSTLLNINNIAAWIRNDGWSARDPGTGNSGVAFPRGTSYCIFQDGIVWGGNVNDGGAQLLRVGGQTYSIGTDAGRIISRGVAARPSDPDVRIYRIRRDYKLADLRQDAAELASKSANSTSQGEIDAVRAQYETDWNEWPASQGAPYYDRDSNGTYNPAIDEPGVADADQVIWFVCNDLNAGRTNALYGSNPIGLELRVTLWGYNRTDPLANVYFKKFTFIYKGHSTTPNGSTITDMYVSQWSDPDEGDAGDDFAGCDTSLGIAYVYNGGPVDAEYAKFGLKPPAAGYDFLQGPIVAGSAGDSAVFNLKRVYGKRNLPMTAAFYFAAGGTYSDPPFTREGTIRWYNLLRGLTPITGEPFIHPRFTSQGPTRFWLDGDPVTGTGRIDGDIDQPGDRRIGACSGPFTMALGDTQEIVVGVVAGIGADYHNSITAMKNNDVAVQNAYNDLFDLPKAPPAPIVKVVQLDKQIVLDWGSNVNAVRATEDYDRKGYSFQGYNVYQVVSLGTSIDLANDKRNLLGRTDVKLLATYDKHGDAIRTIADFIFDASLGITVPIVRQLGTDNGIKRELEINTDLIRSTPLVNGQRYYFAVTAYGYNPSDQALTHALESTPRILTGIPQTTNPGARIYSRYGDTITVTNTNPGIQSDGGVTANVVDPTRVTGKAYNVSFKNVQTTFVYHGTDTLVAPILNWYVTTGSDTVTRGINEGPTVPIDPGNNDDVPPVFGNDFDYPIVDGMFLTVAGPPPQLNDDRCRFVNDDGTPAPASANWLRGGGRFNLSTGVLRSQATTSYDGPVFYFGAVSAGATPDRYRDVEFRFGGGRTQKAYQYSRAVTPQQTGSAYKFRGYLDVPFQVWDVSNRQQPRQLNCGWRDNNLDGVWNVDGPTASASGNLEIIFVTTATYDGVNPTTYINGTVAATLGTSASNMQNRDYQMVAEWKNATGNNADIPRSNILVSPNRVLTANDIFEFTAPAAQSYSGSTAKADVSQINVFPNPYYGFNRAETSRSTSSRFVTFNHMPAKAEIRIFNLAGALVKALVKDDPTQYFTWDLSNTNGFPAASGIYIAYMTLKDAAGVDLGTKTLKMVIIQEQQYLDNF